jgi:uncharacterized protein YkwD
MKKQLFLLILLFPFVSSAKDFFFKRLEKLYAIDKAKCLEVAKRHMQYFPDRPGSYYYASVIYQERSENSRTVQGAYRNLKKSIGYAITFEKKDEEGLREELNWQEFRSDLSRQAYVIIDKLEALDENRFSKALLVRLDKFIENEEVVVVERNHPDAVTDLTKFETTAKPEVVDNENAVILVDKNSTMEFFGMPTGNEMVMAINLDKEKELLRLINQERVRQGMNELVWDDDLAKASRYHSYDLATQNYFNHNSFDRVNGELVKVGNTFDRIRTFYDKSFVNSENIAAGSSTAEDTYHQWYTSKGHYENMFNESAKKVGIGMYYVPNSSFKYYWTFCTAR